MLALLHRGRSLTRAEIARSLRITRSTVSDVLGDLLDQGIITVTEQRSPGGRGRPAEVLGIHPGAVRHAGLDFSHTGVTICLANSAGDVVASSVTAYPEGAGWEMRVRLALRTLRELAAGELHLDFLAGIGIGLPGPNSAGWHGFSAVSSLEPFHLVTARIREQFADAFDCPVLVDHHIRLAALHEAGRDGDGPRDIVYLRLSTGVGGAVLGAGAALRGTHLMAGEIGHMIIDDREEPSPCRCGRRGCLETVASLGAVTRAWQEVAGPDGDDLPAALHAGDPRAHALVTEVAAAVGRVLGTAVLVSDPEEVIVGGEVGALLEPALPTLRATMIRHCLTGANVPVRLGESAPHQGALGAIAALRAAERPPARPRPGRAPTQPPAPLHRAEGGLRVR
ncbi:predicted N-acetyl-glucosamine kinase 2, ROK family [Brachybacterium sp. SW0106-09]|nr:predicted N-acetyl-glucosamine kinase 2, ROK family [Brachybacterium sp. SW0106-09]